MRRALSFVVAAMLFVSIGACPAGRGLSETPVSMQGTLTIDFSYEKQPGVASNQFAVWIEDMEGAHIKTLYVTSYAADDHYRIRLGSLPEWLKQVDAASMEKPEIDAATGPTPGPDKLSYTWDMTDTHGNPVAPGKVRFLVEGSLRWNNRVVCSGVIDTAGGSMTVQGVPEL